MREQEISSRRKTNHSAQTTPEQMGSALRYGDRGLGDTVLGLGVDLAPLEVIARHPWSVMGQWCGALEWVFGPRDLSRPPGGPRNHR